MTRRPPRPQGQLSRTAIVDAAIAHLSDGDGAVDALTIRKLAADLDVSPMALYRHVGGKDEVLLEVTDHLLAARGLPSRQFGWRRFLRELVGGLRELLDEHPALVGVYLRRPVTTPAAVRRLEVALEVLERDGFSRAGAVEAFAAVHTYTLGFSSLAAGRREVPEAAGPGADGAGAGVAVADGASADGPEALIAAFVSPAQYGRGLELVLDGLEQRRTAGTGRRRPTAARPAGADRSARRR